jgi:glycosyltransferase involved in cell wall biosynthesis
MRVAIVHDWLNQFGGGEVVLEALHELFPEAPIYTTLYDADVMPERYRTWDIRTSFLQRLPRTTAYFRYLMPLYPLAIEQFDLSGYDLVISSSSFWAKGVVTHPGTFHICYCHAPMRYAWDVYYESARDLPAAVRVPLAAIVHWLRQWDVVSAQRVDAFVANSRFIAGKINKYYRRDALVIYPPVDTQYFVPDGPVGNYYVSVSRLRPYKRIEIAVEAFNRLGLPLKIIGDGAELSRLRKLAGSKVEVLGWQPRSKLRDYLAHCRGFVLTAKEDFGIAPVEAMAAGRPVVAYGAGGVLETVIEGETGVFFDEQTPESLIEGVRRLEALMPLDRSKIRAHACQYDRAVFLERMRAYIDVCLVAFRKPQAGYDC